MAILPIGAEVATFVPGGSGGPGGPGGVSGVSGIAGIGEGSAPAGGPSFGDLLTRGIENVQATQDTASSLSGKVATGSLTDIHDFTTAAAKASLAVSLTAATRNRAIEAYQEIMRMQL